MKVWFLVFIVLDWSYEVSDESTQEEPLYTYLLYPPLVSYHTSFVLCPLVGADV